MSGDWWVDEGGRAYEQATWAPLDIAPIARDLVFIVDRRAPRKVWELDSLRHRFGIPGRG